MPPMMVNDDGIAYEFHSTIDMFSILERHHLIKNSKEKNMLAYQYHLNETQLPTIHLLLRIFRIMIRKQ